MQQYNNTNNNNYKEIVKNGSPNKLVKNCLATFDQFSMLVGTFPTVDPQQTKFWCTLS